MGLSFFLGAEGALIGGEGRILCGIKAVFCVFSNLFLGWGAFSGVFRGSTG